jgi:SAM-dependent methyltransferase
MKGLLQSIARRLSRPDAAASRGHESGRLWDRVAQTSGDARRAITGHDDPREWEDGGRATADDIIAGTGITIADTVLDIGCGAGRVGVHVAPRVRRWIGADVSRQMLAHARAALAGASNVELVHLSGDGLPPSFAGTVDVVYCTSVFPHLEEWDRYRYVQGAFRALKPGGRLYVDGFSLLGEDGWAIFEQTTRLRPDERPSHATRASTAQELETLARRAGFEAVRVREGPLYVTVFARKPGDATSPMAQTL